MAALAGLVPPLLVSVALVAHRRRTSRQPQRDRFSFGLVLAASPLSPALPLGAWPARAPARGQVAAFASPTPTAPIPAYAPGRPGRTPDGAGHAAPEVPRDEWTCRACGWTLDRPGWTAGQANGAICDCCACEAGVDDVTPDRALAHRRRWIEHGAEWFDPGSRPRGWDLYTHLCERAPL